MSNHPAIQRVEHYIWLLDANRANVDTKDYSDRNLTVLQHTVMEGHEDMRLSFCYLRKGLTTMGGGGGVLRYATPASN